MIDGNDNGTGPSFDREQVFWEQVDDYPDEVVSVFERENELTSLLASLARPDAVAADLGCGPGKALLWLAGFGHIHAVDSSENLLAQARLAHAKRKHVTYHCADMRQVVLPPVDLLLACMSVWPHDVVEFLDYVEHFKGLLNQDGRLVLVVPSFESKLRHFMLQRAFCLSPDKQRHASLTAWEYNPSGYLTNASGMVQKHWTALELANLLGGKGGLRLERMHLDWTTQVCEPQFAEEPELWDWIVVLDPDAGTHPELDIAAPWNDVARLGLRLLDAHPADPMLLSFTARALFFSGRHDEALAMYVRLELLEKDFEPSDRVFRGLTHARMGNVRLAEDILAAVPPSLGPMYEVACVELERLRRLPPDTEAT